MYILRVNHPDPAYGRQYVRVEWKPFFRGQYLVYTNRVDLAYLFCEPERGEKPLSKLPRNTLPMQEIEHELAKQNPERVSVILCSGCGRASLTEYCLDCYRWGVYMPTQTQHKYIVIGDGLYRASHENYRKALEYVREAKDVEIPIEDSFLERFRIVRVDSHPGDWTTLSSAEADAYLNDMNAETAAQVERAQGEINSESTEDQPQQGT